MRGRRLIVSADDFGLSAGVNRGIVRAHRQGILTSTSLMVTAQAAAEAVALAREHPSLSVGLHLVLVHGRSRLGPAVVPLLAAAGGEFGRNAIWQGFRYFFRPGIRAALRREIVAQLDAFAATGLPLSHVDGHLHLHLHPAVLPILIDLAPRYGIRAVRVPREPLRAALRFDRRHAARKTFEGTVFAVLGRYARRRLERAGIAFPDHVFGLHQTGHVTEAYLLHLIPALPPGLSEVYCHAAEPDQESRRWRPSEYEDEKELRALTSEKVRAALAEAGVALATYAALGT